MPKRIAAIVVAGGSSRRFSEGADTNPDKLLALIQGIPVLRYSVQAAFGVDHMAQCIIVCPPDKQAHYQPITHGITHLPIHWANSGSSRRFSVKSGLGLLNPDINWVLVHDAARPMMSTDTLNQFIQAFSGQGGSTLAHPVVDTIKQQTHNGQWQTLPRETLWAVETPQLFEKTALVQAHQSVPEDTPVTDDIQLLELAGISPITLWANPTPNVKITFPSDRTFVDAWMSQNQH
jgi:2-C-methyl-D-erythritol 4-phosphate cytidylyltransferase